MPCCRLPAYHFPHRCPTQSQLQPGMRPVASNASHPHASADTALHRAAEVRSIIGTFVWSCAAEGAALNPTHLNSSGAVFQRSDP